MSRAVIFPQSLFILEDEDEIFEAPFRNCEKESKC